MREFEPFEMNSRVLAAIPNSRENIVLSANTFINLKNLAAKRQEKEEDPKPKKSKAK